MNIFSSVHLIDVTTLIAPNHFNYISIPAFSNFHPLSLSKPVTHAITPLADLPSLLKSIGFPSDNIWINTIIPALLILLITAIGSSVFCKLLSNFLQKDKSPLPQSSIFINIFRIVIWSIGISIMLASCFAVDVSGIIAALGIGGIALSFGLKDTISNFIGGLQMSLMKIVKPGDHIEIAGKQGLVEDINWRHITLETSSEETVILPNSSINSGAIIQLPPKEKAEISLSFDKNTNSLDELISTLEKEAKKELEKNFTLASGPKISLEGVTNTEYSAKLTAWITNHDLRCSHCVEAQEILVRAVTKLVPDALLEN